MHPVSETGREFRLVDRTSGYTGGRTASLTFRVPSTLRVLHAGLSYVQQFIDSPVGAAAGISAFSSTEEGPVFLPDPRDWRAQVYGRVGLFTVGFIVTHGEMRGWFYFQDWGS